MTTATPTKSTLSTFVPQPPPAMVTVTDVYGKDATIAWLRSEFAAANAIIDFLCNHIIQLTNTNEHEMAFAAIQRRRAHWIPVVRYQSFFSVADVVFQLRNVVERREMEVREAEMRNFLEKKKAEHLEVVKEVEEEVLEKAEEKAVVEVEVDVAEEEVKGEVMSMDSTEQIGSVDANLNGSSIGNSNSSSSGSITGGNEELSREEYSSIDNFQIIPEDNLQICSDHESCVERPERIKTCKGFMAKEHVKGHMMNVVKGLKMYEDIFTEAELSRLSKFVNELRDAGRSGELPGETYIFFNKQLKGNKRELIQFGVPIFQSTKEEATSNIDTIPSLLQNVIDHLCQWRLIPESRKPNGCVINFFDEGEFSQPYFKPPHLDNPISTLFLYETTMAFGRLLSGDNDGNYKGSLTLPIKEGSLVVMRGNSADMARNVVCPSPNTRVCITFLRVRPPKNTVDLLSSTATPPLTAMTLWQPENPVPQPLGYVSHPMSPRWGMTLPPPVLVLATPTPTPTLSPTPVNSTRKSNRNSGTGVFLPWTVGPKKYIKHLPPRIQKRRLHSLALAPSLEMQVEKAAQIPCIAV